MTKSPFAAYAETQRAGLTGRALEASVLLKAAQQLNEARTRLMQDDALTGSEALLHNRRVWEILMLSATEATHPLPHETKKAIANIGLFVLRHTYSQLAKASPAGLTTLIELNRTIAEGLMAKPQPHQR